MWFAPSWLMHRGRSFTGGKTFLRVISHAGANERMKRAVGVFMGGAYGAGKTFARFASVIGAEGL